ncbi:CHASE2 domain-containing protein [Microcoleus sp. PH2017_18_LLB_O_A]|uniref:sensor histidine kinase n=1 Tax=Microcoleus sp. PH2017_18_LLB_O_A TaxID=2798829 RepID=UPI001D8279CA|nr:CHASE2 domain-containing protein [Microcoleus sp. PH2017_18_LLB_O_A]MCC3514018.1 CHASE2 domain-containing protein [Microcoleus sp. PH2017_18_LLB_O_A]
MKPDRSQAVKADISTWWRGSLPGLMVIVAVMMARLTGALQFVELVAFDRFLLLRPPEPMDERIIIVGITEEDIKRAKTYPIPDREIADLLKRLQTYEPIAIGLDIVRDIPVEPGHAELASVFRNSKNAIGVEIALPDRNGFIVAPPPALRSEQIGFADFVLDGDGYQRRSLLGTYNDRQEYRFSFAIRLAERYLANRGIKAGNGIRDREAMRFGNIELTRMRPNSGGYVGADAGGNQILLNVRSGLAPFRVISLAQIKAGKVDPNWIRGKIVLIGMMSFSAKDLASSGAIAGINPGRIYGVEMQAHETSQIISAVLDRRPLIQVWGDDWETLWIGVWGLLGMSLGRFLRSPWKILLGLLIASISSIAICYGLILMGWWMPIVPVFLILVLNGAGRAAALFYRHQQELRLRLEERQFAIEQTFNAIHSGPLQTLVVILRTAQEQDPPPSFLTDLQRLNQELREVYGSVQRDAIADEPHLRMGSAIELALQAPLHELLYKVYSNTLEQELPYLQTIKFKIVQFDPLNTEHLRLEHKRGLCRFLEEALCNVGKHAIAATRLTVICTQEGDRQVIRVVDNGNGKLSEIEATIQDSNTNIQSSGLGTQLANNLAKQLGGTFRRYQNVPKGTVCELSWSAKRRWFW